jgi:hypothetical protein
MVGTDKNVLQHDYSSMPTKPKYPISFMPCRRGKAVSLCECILVRHRGRFRFGKGYLI